MIYFVDEDYQEWGESFRELREREFQVTGVWNANDAYPSLRSAAEGVVELAVIDVMLAVKDVSDEQFSIERTKTYAQTGVCLLEDLVNANPAVFPACAVFFTNAVESDLATAQAVADEFGIPLWPKWTFTSDAELTARVIEQIESLRGETPGPRAPTVS